MVVSDLANKIYRQRYLVFICAMLAELFGGITYAWTVLQTAFVNENSWDKQEIAYVYTVLLAVTCLSPIPLTSLVNRLTIRQNILVGTVLYALGIFLCSYITAVWQLYLYLGVIAGLGVGFIYPQLLAYAIKLFPHKGSLASGMMATAYGLGAVVWSPVAEKLIGAKGLNNSFMILGLLYLVVLLILCIFLYEVPSDYVKLFESSQKNTTSSKKSSPTVTSTRDYTLGQMVKTPTYWLMLIGFSFGLTAGALVVSQSRDIISLSGSDISNSITWLTPAICVSIISAFNAFGRSIWGAIATKIGVYYTLITACALTALFMLVLSISSNGFLVLALLSLVAMCYGGQAALLTPMTRTFFGLKNLTTNFGALIAVYAIASFFGPLITTQLASETSYTKAYIAAVVFGIAGMLLGVILLQRYRKLEKEEANLATGKNKVRLNN